MNRERIQKLIEFFQEHPRAGTMLISVECDDASVDTHRAVTSYNYAAGFDFNGEAMAACGTVGCIAGWAVLLFSGELVPGYDPTVGFEATAKKLLDLNDLDARSVFFGHLWPEGLHERILSAMRALEAEPSKARKMTALMVERLQRLLKEDVKNEALVD